MTKIRTCWRLEQWVVYNKCIHVEKLLNTLAMYAGSYTFESVKLILAITLELPWLAEPKEHLWRTCIIIDMLRMYMLQKLKQQKVEHLHWHTHYFSKSLRKHTNIFQLYGQKVSMMQFAELQLQLGYLWGKEPSC